MRSGDTNVGRHDQHGLSLSSLLSVLAQICRTADRNSKDSCMYLGLRTPLYRTIRQYCQLTRRDRNFFYCNLATTSVFPIHYHLMRAKSALSLLFHTTQTNTLFDMSSLSGNSILTTVGCLLIIHSAYSCLHYRSLALVADLTDTSSPPVDVIIEVILGFVTCLVGQLMCGPFHRVRVTGGPLLGGLPKTKAGGDSTHRYIQGEIVAPVYRTRDFDLFSTSAAAATRRSMAMTRLEGN